MDLKLKGKKIAILATNGVEKVELTEPRRALEDAGADVELLAPEDGMILAMDHDEKDGHLRVDKAVGDARPEEYDGLVLPGGVMNGDKLRMDDGAVRFVRTLLEHHVPVGVICHGPWILIETGLLKGRTLTSYPTLQTDIRNAGATWVDEMVHNDDGLISSRRPSDLEAFNETIVEAFAGRQEMREAA